jgi:hypothetical protein
MFIWDEHHGEHVGDDVWGEMGLATCTMEVLK